MYTLPLATTGGTNLIVVPNRSRPGFCSVVQISCSVSALYARSMPATRAHFAFWLVGIDAQTIPVFAAVPFAEIVSDPPGCPGDRAVPCAYGAVRRPPLRRYATRT